MSHPLGELPFISTGEVVKRLGASRSTLQNMFAHLPYLYVIRVETRLFPAPYINAYAAYLRQSRLPATVESAARFWKTDEALRLYAEAVTHLEAGLSPDTLTGQQLAALLGVSYQTVMSWRRLGALGAPRRTGQPPASRQGRTQGAVRFPSPDIKRALEWKTPATRKEYVPPSLKSMFMSADDIQALARSQRRQLQSTAQFGQLQTPGGGRTMPTTYVEALLHSVGGTISAQAILAFNGTDLAQRIMAAAREEFTWHMAERLGASPFTGLLVLDDVAWLLGMTRGMVNNWCVNNQLPYVEGSGRKLIRPQILQAHCRWVLPTQR